MATPQSPFSFAQSALDRLGKLVRPPRWLVDELQQRLVLLLNHVLQQEPEAQERLRRQKGSVVRAKWRDFEIQFVATPAGLLDRAEPGARADLVLTLTQTSPFDLARSAVRGDKPAVRIQGDVQLAAEINWLVDHVRWDVEEDLAKVIGDAPAHALADAGRRAATALRGFVAEGGDQGGGKGEGKGENEREGGKPKAPK